MKVLLQEAITYVSGGYCPDGCGRGKNQYVPPRHDNSRHDNSYQPNRGDRAPSYQPYHR